MYNISESTEVAADVLHLADAFKAEIINRVPGEHYGPYFKSAVDGLMDASLDYVRDTIGRNLTPDGI